MVKKLDTILVLKKERKKALVKVNINQTQSFSFFSSTNLIFDNCCFHVKLNLSPTSQLLKVVKELFFDLNCRTKSSRT